MNQNMDSNKQLGPDHSKGPSSSKAPLTFEATVSTLFASPVAAASLPPVGSVASIRDQVEFPASIGLSIRKEPTSSSKSPVQPKRLMITNQPTSPVCSAGSRISILLN